MKITLTGVRVDDQAKAFASYTNVLGFVKNSDSPVGDFRWLTVVSPEDPDGAKLLLEAMGMEFARTFQGQLHGAGIPLTSFAVDEIYAEYERLKGPGVRFTTEPTDAGPATIAMFDNTCGKLIQIHQA